MSGSQILIPWPVKAEFGEDKFVIGADISIHINGEYEGWQDIGAYLANRLTKTSIARSSIAARSKDSGVISLRSVPPDSELGDEGYRLTIDSRHVLVEAAQPAGAFYAVQTLLQLAEVNPGAPQLAAWTLPAVSIADYPRYVWRGLMLDVARHFFPVTVIKQVIDWLAAYKMNRLHLHLTDDQGWRIEVKSWPRLAEIGGSSAVGGSPGGFYTQEEYKDITRYAAERFVTIVPEIDLPGHTSAALASYPELSCSERAPQLYSGIDVGFSSLCIEKEITYQFVSDVLAELAAITPGAYLHIGGDESHSTETGQYLQFMERVKAIVRETDKQMVGWQEVGQAEILPGCILQYWDDRVELPKIVRGIQIIMSPASRAYLDMKMDETVELGSTWAGLVDLQRAYDWDPDRILQGLPKESIVGLEAALWTETIANQNDMETMLFPRLPGYAEVSWSPLASRKWEDYLLRLRGHVLRWEQVGINYYRSNELKNATHTN